MFVGRDEVLDGPGGDIILALVKSDTEQKVQFYGEYGGWCLRC